MFGWIVTVPRKIILQLFLAIILFGFFGLKSALALPPWRCNILGLVRYTPSSIPRILVQNKNHALYRARGLEEVHQVIAFANEQFRRRQWSEEFIGNRDNTAEKYLSQSKYAYTRYRPKIEYAPGSIVPIEQGPTPMSGTIATTSAEYTRENPYAQILTMEDRDIKGAPSWKLKRVFTKNGKGKLIEARTYSKDRKAGDGPYHPLWAEMNAMIHEELVDYPELWDEEIVFTFGDDTSIAMYSDMGFKVADHDYPPIPFFYQGKLRYWHVLKSSPSKMLNAFLSKIKDDALISVTGYDGPLLFKTAVGLELIADGTKPITMYDLKTPAFFYLFDRTEVLPGYWVNGGRIVWFHPTGQVRGLVVENETEVMPGIVAGQMTYVGFHENGNPRVVAHIAHDIIITNGSPLRFAHESVLNEIPVNGSGHHVLERGMGLSFDSDGAVTGHYTHRYQRGKNTYIGWGD